ncbi:ropporin-1-like protein isoform X1 [Heterocephalus glaber]|uniref:Ropporin-1-like protein n=1 Tax=Heterocephalus glaber TaxID=10181 RepID=A0AAX6T117_HETGA|nr:ropporin-1-like protein isoform X1 [Heterocephalus glaber]XP_021114278.1 ropporin-1-like protein isoform X1 [Heterocephalus glaber]
MPLPDTMFCAQQIHIPPELPDILKQFTKAAIRTQPADLLQWSAGYFLALSQGDPLPIKDRVELSMATQKTDTGLTQGLLRVLHKQCSHEACVALPELEHKWRTLCLPVEKLRALIGLDPCEDEIEHGAALLMFQHLKQLRSETWTTSVPRRQCVNPRVPELSYEALLRDPHPRPRGRPGPHPIRHLLLRVPLPVQAGLGRLGTGHGVVPGRAAGEREERHDRTIRFLRLTEKHSETLKRKP